MQWNVLHNNFNGREIETYDIFKHHSFNEAVKKLLKEEITKKEFAEKLRRELSYYFWAKCEMEVVVTSWPCYIDQKELDRLNKENEEGNKRYGHYPYKLNVDPDVGKKIDIYDQVYGLNWNVFVDYVWSHKKEKKQ